VLRLILATALVPQTARPPEDERLRYTIAATIAPDAGTVHAIATIRVPARSGVLRFGVKRLRITRVSRPARFDADSAVMTVAARPQVVVEYTVASDTSGRRQLG
jgi:hypothetical protein